MTTTERLAPWVLLARAALRRTAARAGVAPPAVAPVLTWWFRIAIFLCVLLSLVLLLAGERRRP